VPTLGDIIAEAFLAGAKEEAKRQAKALGKKTVVYTLEAASDAASMIDSTLDQAEATVVRAIKTKRKPSAYALKYGRAFKSIASQYKTKSGSWKKDGFKRAQKAAHMKARKMK